MDGVGMLQRSVRARRDESIEVSVSSEDSPDLSNTDEGSSDDTETCASEPDTDASSASRQSLKGMAFTIAGLSRRRLSDAQTEYTYSRHQLRNPSQSTRKSARGTSACKTKTQSSRRWRRRRKIFRTKTTTTRERTGRRTTITKLPPPSQTVLVCSQPFAHFKARPANTFISLSRLTEAYHLRARLIGPQTAWPALRPDHHRQRPPRAATARNIARQQELLFPHRLSQIRAAEPTSAGPSGRAEKQRRRSAEEEK